MKALKREAIYTTSYRDLDHLRSNLAAFIDQYYNGTRGTRLPATERV